MITARDARRRWFGAFFLLVAIGMLTWGLVFLGPYLIKKPVAFVLYWAGCASFTGLAFLTAMLDMVIMRRRLRDEQIALAHRALSELSDKEED